MTTTANTEGRTMTDQTYFVFYGDHDRGCKPGFMVREGLEIAQRSAKLMGECGYRFVDVRHALSISEVFDG